MEILTNLIGPEWLERLSSSKVSTTFVLASSVVVIIITYNFKKWLDMKKYFKRMNIPAPTPLPIVGNLLGIMKNKIYMNDKKLLEEYGDTCGYHEGSQPVILTKDLKFIKTITIRDFNHFTDRRIFEPLVTEPFDKFLTVLRDDEWKNVRAIVSTTFTSGKLKQMSKCIGTITKNYEEYLDNEIEKNNGIISTKTFYGSYTLDVISSCCFGMEINSIKDPTNIFLENLQKMFASAQLSNPRFILLFAAPKFANFLVQKNIMDIFPRGPLYFLSDVTNQIIDNRKKKLDRRDDFIQNMIEHEESVEKESANSKPSNEDNISGNWNKHLKKSLTNNEILSQAILFFIAGYETTATTLEWITYNLARNQDVQNKLIEEVDAVLDKYNGEVSYDSISEMKYMDMVIDETLRLCPPATRTDRTCTADYEYNGMKIKKGTEIGIAIYAIHYDANIYPEPELFKPERFSEENKKKRDNETFIPFGSGPRSCIGMRFALIEIKLMLATIMSKFRFETCSKTIDKISFDNSALARSEKPIFIKFCRR